MTNTSVLAPPAKPPANPTPAKANSFYKGTYQNAYYGSVTIDDPGGRCICISAREARTTTS